MYGRTTQDIKLDFRQYGEIIVPKGTLCRNTTDKGELTENYFVIDVEWVKKNYSAYSNILIMDIENHGMLIDKRLIKSE